jgi:hypothetical protein
MELARTIFGIVIGVFFFGLFIFIQIYTHPRQKKEKNNVKKE